MNARFWQFLSLILFIILLILGGVFLLQAHDTAWQDKLAALQENMSVLQATAYQQGAFDTLSQIVTITAQCKPLPARLGNLSVTLIAAECLRAGNQTR